jgi:class 3 adenylate cyclase
MHAGAFRRNNVHVVDAAPDAPVTVMVTDVEGSTELQGRLGDIAARQLMREQESIIRAALAEFGGREIKTMGDGFLVCFVSTRRALECACSIQRELADQTDLRVRIGLHVGEVIHERGDVHGGAVSATTRIAGQARGGEIIVSDLVRQLAGTAGVDFRERGPVQLKGLDEPMLLHEIVWQTGAGSFRARRAPRRAGPSVELVGRQRELAVVLSG